MKILVINKLLKEHHKEQILKNASEIGGSVLFVESEAEIPDDYQDCEIIYGFGMGNAARNKNLKWLSVPSAGVDYLMKPGVFANEDCLITNSTGAYGVTIAEHIIAVSLLMMRKLDYSYSESLKHNWSSPKPQRSLKDSRILVLGTGDIGCCFARRAKAFEPHSITGVCRSGICEDRSFDRVFKTDALDELLPETDLLVMSLPDTPETRNTLSRERIALLPEDAFVVNVGRGSAIDEKALTDALNEGKLAGAALDVMQTEPVPADSPLRTAKNILLTPHCAGQMTLDYTREKSVEMFCEDLENYLSGKALVYGVSKERGY